MEEATIGQMLMEQVVPPLITIVGAALGILVVWLKSKTGKAIRANIGEGLAQKALLMANGVIMDLVGEASQTTVRELKLALTDGKIDEAEYRNGLRKIKEAIVTKAWGQTGGRLLGSGAVSSDVHGLAVLASKVEAAVPLAKAAQAAATNGKATPANPPQG
jgi:hypothetical protein